MNELSEVETEDFENLERITVVCKACLVPFDYVRKKSGGTKAPLRKYCERPYCLGPKYPAHNQRAKKTNPTRLAFSCGALNEKRRTRKRVRMTHVSNDITRTKDVRSAIGG